MISSIQLVDVDVTPVRIIFSNASIMARERLYVLRYYYEYMIIIIMIKFNI